MGMQGDHRTYQGRTPRRVPARSGRTGGRMLGRPDSEHRRRRRCRRPPTLRERHPPRPRHHRRREPLRGSRRSPRPRQDPRTRADALRLARAVAFLPRDWGTASSPRTPPRATRTPGPSWTRPAAGPGSRCPATSSPPSPATANSRSVRAAARSASRPSSPSTPRWRAPTTGSPRRWRRSCAARSRRSARGADHGPELPGPPGRHVPGLRRRLRLRSRHLRPAERRDDPHPPLPVDRGPVGARDDRGLGPRGRRRGVPAPLTVATRGTAGMRARVVDLLESEN